MMASGGTPAGSTFMTAAFSVTEKFSRNSAIRVRANWLGGPGHLAPTYRSPYRVLTIDAMWSKSFAMYPQLTSAST